MIESMINALLRRIATATGMNTGLILSLMTMTVSVLFFLYFVHKVDRLEQCRYKAREELRIAFCRDHPDEFNNLLQKHENIIDGDAMINRNNWLYWACSWDHLNIVKCIVKRKDIDVNARYYNLRTPLHTASTLPIIKLLLSRKDIDSNAKDCNGRTPLDYVSQRGDLHIANYFLARGMSIKKAALQRMPADKKKLWSAWTAFLSLENAEKESAFLLVSLPARKTNFLECDGGKIINLFVYFSHWQKNICPNMRVIMNLYGAYLQYKNHATIEQPRRFMDIMEKAVTDEKERSEILDEIQRLSNLDTFKHRYDMRIKYL